MDMATSTSTMDMATGTAAASSSGHSGHRMGGGMGHTPGQCRISVCYEEAHTLFNGEFMH
jgi:hypothetical protein